MVFGMGNQRATLMFVGGTPGVNEDIRKRQAKPIEPQTAAPCQAIALPHPAPMGLP